jgi:hypothetical protein
MSHMYILGLQIFREFRGGEIIVHHDYMVVVA